MVAKHCYHTKLPNIKNEYANVFHSTDTTKRTSHFAVTENTFAYLLRPIAPGGA